MGDIVLIKVDKRLVQEMEIMRKSMASGIKEQFGLDEIVIHGTLISKVIADRLAGKDKINFKINKVGRGRGIIHI